MRSLLLAALLLTAVGCGADAVQNPGAQAQPVKDGPPPIKRRPGELPKDRPTDGPPRAPNKPR
jgi:hypothetical protein